jgi:hypothetical protein
MKKILLLLFLFCTAFAAISKPRAPDRLHLKVHYTPLIVVGSLVECGFDAKIGAVNGKLRINMLLKGDAKTAKLLEVDFQNDRQSRRFPVSETIKPNYKKGQTKVFFLYKNRNEKWEISNFSLNYSKNKVGLVTKTVSIDDFKVGIALFSEKYTFFEQKEAEKTPFILENRGKNETFAVLAKEMLGKLVEIPEIKEKQQPTKPLPTKPLYLRIHQTPTIVYGVLSRTTQTEGTLLVSENIKSSAKKNDKMTIAIPKPNLSLPIKSPIANLSAMEIGGKSETDIYFLYQNEDKKWEISRPFEGTGLKMNAENKIVFLGITVSIIDFKVGIALFEQKYSSFQEKLSQKMPFVLENAVNNHTFAALAKQMLGDLVEIPKKVVKKK